MELLIETNPLIMSNLPASKSRLAVRNVSASVSQFPETLQRAIDSNGFFNSHRSCLSSNSKFESTFVSTELLSSGSAFQKLLELLLRDLTDHKVAVAMNRKKLITLMIIFLLIIAVTIILYALFQPSDDGVQDGRSLQDQQIDNYIQQNDNKPVIQTEEDLWNEMRSQ